jgi:hypothetical protein
VFGDHRVFEEKHGKGVGRGNKLACFSVSGSSQHPSMSQLGREQGVV